METTNNNQKNKKMTFSRAVICIICMVMVLMLGFAILGLDTNVVFIIASVVVGVLLIIYKFKRDDVFNMFLEGAKGSMELVLILMTVGVVIGSWIVSGVIPSIIYYGLKILTPSVFLITGFLLCCIVSVFIGSSYSTIATMGVAFMGIGLGLGINPGLTAGMVLSGALFGDKMSPFSDTTNLAAVSSGSDLYRHINSMFYTTIPASIITLILLGIFSFRISGTDVDMALVGEMMGSLEANFNITPILFLVPIITIFLAIKKVPPVIAMLISSFGAIVFAFILQGQYYGFQEILASIGPGISKDFGQADVNLLLNRGGVMSMMTVVSWTIIILGLGNMLRESGVIAEFLNKLLGIVKSKGALVISTLLFSLITAALTASQYLAIMLPGQLMRPAYTKFKVDKRVLSRTLEDGGTMFSFLIPWDTAGIYASAVLGISVLTYAPYAFFLWLCPIIALIYAITGFAIFPDEDLVEEPETI